jgi:hypothetical protein
MDQQKLVELSNKDLPEYMNDTSEFYQNIPDTLKPK